MNQFVKRGGLTLVLLLSSQTVGWGQSPILISDESVPAFQGSSSYTSPAPDNPYAPPNPLGASAPEPPLDTSVGKYDDHYGATCSTCLPGGCVCKPCYTYRHSVYGEYLYLSPRNFDVAYAQEVNGPVAPPPNQGIQVGPVASPDLDYDSGFRAGFAFALSDCASIGAAYTYFDTGEADLITRTGTNDIRSLVVHPLTTNAASDWLDAAAVHNVKFEFADVEYRWLYHGGHHHAVNFTVGARYASLEQDFASLFTANDFRYVTTGVDFDGGGLRLGLDFERHTSQRGFFLYGKGHANFIAGTFHSDYLQGSLVDPIEVNTSWKDERIVTILEMELGIGWQSPSGRWRASGGYLVSAWFNTITTETFIDAVQASHFTDVQDTVAFDGLTARVEYRF